MFFRLPKALRAFAFFGLLIVIFISGIKLLVIRKTRQSQAGLVYLEDTATGWLLPGGMAAHPLRCPCANWRRAAPRSPTTLHLSAQAGSFPCAAARARHCEAVLHPQPAPHRAHQCPNLPLTLAPPPACAGNGTRYRVLQRKEDTSGLSFTVEMLIRGDAPGMIRGGEHAPGRLCSGCYVGACAHAV